MNLMKAWPQIDVLIETAGKMLPPSIVGPDGIELRYFSEKLAGPRDDDDTVLEIPGYRQTESYTCGFTAGLMILHTFRPGRSPQRFFSVVSPDRTLGTDTPRLRAALKAGRIGTRAMRVRTHDAIADRIEAGEPIVTVVSSGGPDFHWVVLYGVRRGRDVFVAGNGLPFVQNDIYSWGRFHRIWRPEHGAFSCFGT